MTAVGIHQIAVSLFNLDKKLHNGEVEAIMSWQEPVQSQAWEDARGRIKIQELPRAPVYPTLLMNLYYLDHEQYPSGVADIAGYWAEDCIFGGVVLFDRGESDDDVSLRSSLFTQPATVYVRQFL